MIYYLNKSKLMRLQKQEVASMLKALVKHMLPRVGKIKSILVERPTTSITFRVQVVMMVEGHYLLSKK